MVALEVALEGVLGVVIGFVVGLLGGGGAVLTVPVLVFVVGLPPEEATTISLVVVAIASTVGIVGHGGSGGVAWRQGLLLALLGVVGAVGGSRLALFVHPDVLLAAFGVLLLVSGSALVRRPSTIQEPEARSSERSRRLRIVAAASIIGFVTGFLGVGGGFLVVPVLVLFLRLPMSRAIGTSLLVIAVNSVVALVARVGAEVDPQVTITVAGGAAVGAVAGVLVSKRLSGPILQRVFSAVVLSVGTATLATVVAGVL